MNEITIVKPTTPLPALPMTAIDYASKATASSTARAYRFALEGFVKWCAVAGRQPMPADPETVADYLTHRANNGIKVATLSLALAAIVSAHRLSGHALDAKVGLLAATWKGIRRQCVTKQRQAEPLSKADLVEALKLLGDGMRGKQDRALLAFGLMAARRRSELSGLDLGCIGCGTGFVAVDSRGAEIVLLRSKSSQDEAQTFAILRQYAPVAVAALESWIEAAGIVEGSPLFRGVSNSGTVSADRLSDNGVGRTIKRSMVKLAKSRGMTADEANRFAEPYSGHSLRVGFAVEAVNAGEQHGTIADHMGHSSTDMTRRYAKRATKGQALAKVGL